MVPMVTNCQLLISMRATEFPWVTDERLLQSLTGFAKRPNILVVCEGVEPRVVTTSLQDWCEAPYHLCRLPGPLWLPESKNGSLVLENVSAMTLPQQIAFHDWLDSRRGDLQIVSATARPLWPL